MTQTVKVGILGATGMVGQRFATLLDNHPYFRVTEVVASERSAGKLYRDAATWVVDDPLPAWIRDMRVKTPADDLDVDLVFSNARDHRWDADVPLLLPEVNPEHLSLVERQKTPGKIVTNGNCSTITAVMSLKPLHDVFGLRRVFFATYQAVSGAGYPG